MIIDMIFRFFSYTRVYLKTHDVTGSEGFCVAQDIFSQEY